MREPTLYLSLFFKTHRAVYYDLLQRVRTDGDWESWLRFFLEGVVETADQAAQTARSLLHLFEADAKRLETLGRAAASAGLLHGYLQQHAITTPKKAASALGLSEPTANAALRHLQSLGIVRETTGKKRRRAYAYGAYLDLIIDGGDSIQEIKPG